MALFVGGQDFRPAMTGWAVELLLDGREGEAITLLAGADLEKDRELLQLFRKAAREQKVKLPEQGEELPWLERWLCGEIVGGRMEPAVGLKKLYVLYPNSNWDRRFIRWCYLSESLVLLKEGIFELLEPFEQMTLETFPEVMIAQAAEVLLQE